MISAHCSLPMPVQNLNPDETHECKIVPSVYVRPPRKEDRRSPPTWRTDNNCLENVAPLESTAGPSDVAMKHGPCSIFTHINLRTWIPYTLLFIPYAILSHTWGNGEVLFEDYRTCGERISRIPKDRTKLRSSTVSKL